MALRLVFVLSVAMTLGASTVHSWSVPMSCPDHSWKLVQGRCIKAFTNHGLQNWQYARNFCKRFPNGDLVHIRNLALNHAVQGVLPVKNARFWIGANDIKHEGRFVFGDNTPVSQQCLPWSRGQPDNYGNCEDCVEMWQANGKWNDVNCIHNRYWVCQSNSVTPPPSCPDHSWSHVSGGVCIKAFGHFVSWQHAYNYCRTKFTRGSLVIIDSAAKNLAVKSLLSGSSTYWTSANDIKHEGRFVYGYSNYPLRYKNWAAHQPDNYKNGEDCVEFHAATGKWNDIPCALKRRFVCQVGGNIPTGCPPGYQLYTVGNITRCIRINTFLAKFQQLCQLFGGFFKH